MWEIILHSNNDYCGTDNSSTRMWLPSPWQLASEPGQLLPVQQYCDHPVSSKTCMSTTWRTTCCSSYWSRVSLCGWHVVRNSLWLMFKICQTGQILYALFSKWKWSFLPWKQVCYVKGGHKFSWTSLSILNCLFATNNDLSLVHYTLHQTTDACQQ